MRRPPPSYYRPTRLPDALDLKRRWPDAHFMAGGTLLMAADGTSPGPLIDILDLPEIQAFGPVDLPGGHAGWRLGAGVIWQDLLRPGLPSGLVLWQCAAAGIASAAIRATGTLGGSWAAPAGGDAQLAAMACGGVVHFMTIDGVAGSAEIPPPQMLALSFDLPLSDISVWVGIGERGDARGRAALTLTRTGGRCTGMRLARRWGNTPPERWGEAEAACIDLPLVALAARLRALANGCPLALLLARRLTEAFPP